MRYTVPRILIVDDDLQFQRTLRLAMDAYGYLVCSAAGGREALDTAAATPPDLVVLDWHLPDMDGIQTCRALRAHSDVPVLMISADRSNQKDVALDAGANDYLPKPFSVNELLAWIETALNR